MDKVLKINPAEIANDQNLYRFMKVDFTVMLQ